MLNAFRLFFIFYFCSGPLRAFDEDEDASLTWYISVCAPVVNTVELARSLFSLGNTYANNYLCPFRLDSTTGTLSVSLFNGAQLDHESISSWNVKVVVEDQWSAMDIGYVVVHVLDVNEWPEILPPTINRTIAENAVSGDLVMNGTIVGYDQDAASTLSYRLVGSSSHFIIDSSSGDIILKESTAQNQVVGLNYEQKSSYFIKVEARDDGTPSLTSITTEIHIYIIDVNEPPVIPTEDVTTSWTIPEMSINGTLLTSTTSSSSSSSSVVASIGGNVINGGVNGNGVNGNGVNGGVGAWDPENGTLTYSLISSMEENPNDDENYPFGIRVEEGVLYVQGVLDYETISFYEFEIEVTDEGGLKDSVSMSVVVTDANEAPVLSNETYTFTVQEDEEVRATIGVPCSAMDLDEEQDVTYTLRVVSSSSVTGSGDVGGAEEAIIYNMTYNSDSGASSSEMFGIVDCSGQILLLRPLDYESQREWFLEVTGT